MEYDSPSFESLVEPRKRSDLELFAQLFELSVDLDDAPRQATFTPINSQSFEYELPLEYRTQEQKKYLDRPNKRLIDTRFINESYVNREFEIESIQKNYIELNMLKKRDPIINLGAFALQGKVSISENLINNNKYKKIIPDNIVKSPISREELEALRQLEETRREAETQKTRQLQRAAHSFRSQRMRLGVMAERSGVLQEQAGSGLKKIVSRMTRRAGQLNEGTTRSPDLEMHRLYTPLISGYMVTEQGRKLFMDSLDSAAKEDSDALKAEAKLGTLEADYVVVGSGVQASVFVASLRAQKPDANVIVIGQEEKLGGQFRKYGERPTFRINSRAHRRQDLANSNALPGQPGNLNPFGEQAPLQITDVCSETYPTNIDMGNTAAINLFLSARTMLRAKFSGIEENEGENKAYTLNVIDSDTGEQMQINGDIVVSFPGLGERSDPFGVEDERYLQAEDFLQDFGDSQNPFPMDKYIGKRVAVIGAGDTGRIITELLTRLGPKEAYGQSIVQLGSGPEEIVWYGADDATKKGYLAVNRPRYGQIATFIGENGQNFACKVTPDVERASVVEDSDGKLIVRNASGKPEEFDYVINTISFFNTALDPFDALSGTPAPVSGSISTTREIAQIAVSVSAPQYRLGKVDRGVYVAGPAAGSPLAPREKQSFADGITETQQTVALWANTPRTESLVKFLLGK